MFIGYRQGNLHFANGGLRVRVLAVLAWVMGVTIHVNGVPFGACTGQQDVMGNPAIGWQQSSE